MFKINEGALDRLLRVTFGAMLLLAGAYWLNNILMWFAAVIGVVLILTGSFGFCGLYPLIKRNTLQYGKEWPKWVIWLWLVLLAVGVVAGAWASNFFTRKFFLEDYNAMNAPYKQALFQTGQGNADLSRSNLNAWVDEAVKFQAKYKNYRPWFLKADKQFTNDLITVDSFGSQAVSQIDAGNLAEAHLSLEKVRPIYNEMLKRNGFSLLAVALVDFHDVMETVLDAANAKDPTAVLEAYAKADEKLKDIESQADDQEIKDIRNNLEAVKKAATDDVQALPDLAAKLKSSFVKVYLSRG